MINYVLEISDKERKADLDDVLRKVKDCNFQFFNDKTDEQILKMLTTYKKHKGRRGKGSNRAPIFTSFHDRWNKDRHWKRMLCDIQCNVVRRIYDNCFRKECPHKASSHEKASRIAYALHFDHQKEEGQWRKVKLVSHCRGEVEAMTTEMIKCRIACAYDHEFGRGTAGYEEKLKMKLTHQYKCGQESHTIKNIINTREMKLLLLELKSRGALKGKDKLEVNWYYSGSMLESTLQP